MEDDFYSGDNLTSANEGNCTRKCIFVLNLTPMRQAYVLYFILLLVWSGCSGNQTPDSGKENAKQENRLPAQENTSTGDNNEAKDSSRENKEFEEISAKEKEITGIQQNKGEVVHKKELNNKRVVGEIQSPRDKIAPVTLKSEAKKFCDFFKTYEEPSQFYNVPANQIKEVKGKAGTVIQINPDDLVTLQNQAVEKSIDVELKELTKQEQLLRTNAQTVCNGKLLVSGGAYFINLKSEGQPLKLKPGRSLSVKFPKLTDVPMGLFAGHRDSLGQMQWLERKQLFRNDPLQGAWRDTRNTIIQYDGDILEIDTLKKRKPKEKTETEKKKEQAYEKVYSAMDIQSLGWINCDRFYTVQDKTNLSVTIEEREKIPFASIYLVFDEMNSIMQTHYGATENGVSNPGFENIPVGAKVRLIAFALKDDKILASSIPLVIKKNETRSITLSATTDEELKQLLKKN